MTAKETFYGKKCATKNTEPLDTLIRVLRAGWVEFAARLVCKSTEWAVVEGEGVLVETDEIQDPFFKNV